MLRRFFIILNILALAVLLLSCLAAFINPNTFWQLSFFGFAFPAVLVSNFAFLLVWAFARSKFVLVPLIAIVLSWKFIMSSFAVNFSPNKSMDGIKLMTWNVKNFDLYNWSHNVSTRSKMMELIEREKPGIICLQEFYSNNQLFHNLEYLRDTLGYKYCYFPPSLELTKQPQTRLQKTLWKKGQLVQRWGVATFSKYPIVDTGHIDFDNAVTNNCTYVNIDVGGKIIRLYNGHFQSIHLGYDDYNTIEELEETQQSSWKNIKGILRKMKKAYTLRAQQVTQVRQHMDGYAGAKVLCGDFNDVPVSFAYKTIRQDMQDAFVEQGNGFGATFINRFTFFRIDYAFFDTGIRVGSYKTIRESLSDHYPVCVQFSL